MSHSPRSSTSSILENINEFSKADNDPEKGERLQPEKLHSWSRKYAMRMVLIIIILAIVNVNLFLFTNHSSKEVRKNPLTLEDLRLGKFYPIHKSINWLDLESSADAGEYLTLENGVYYRANLNYPDDKIELSAKFVKISGENRTINSFVLNRQGSRVLLSTEQHKNWRHSTYSHYWVLDLESKTFSPVHTSDENAQVSLALWSPRGDRISYVLDNNLYIRTVGEHGGGISTQITFDGGQDVMYGVPDWVYEEEVLQTGTAMWWSTNGEYLAFSKFNDTEVPVFTIPYVVQKGNDACDGYPVMKDIKYPKPGYDNPIAELMFLRIADEQVFQIPIEGSLEDDIITEIVWTQDSRALVRYTNRESDQLRVSVVDANTKTSERVRSLNFKDLDGGWFEVIRTTKFVPEDRDKGRDADGYIDTVVIDGYNHLAYFSPIDSSEPKTVLTSGKWEVDGEVNFDISTNTVYFTSTESSPMERHLYSVDLLQGEESKRAVTNVSDEAYYSVSFSSNARYLLLTYQGPSIPWQKVVDLHQDDAIEKGVVVEDNAGLRDTLAKYEVPSVVYSQIEVDKDADGNPILVNVKEILPPGFYEHGAEKYPVLFAPYGGPASQRTGKQFSVSFENVVSSQHGVVVVVLDGRGTGFMGRDFRCAVRGNLGELEAHDQIAGAKEWASRPYVDEDHIAIWGWSYGGYLTLKTLEQDAGQTFSYGMAVAPVTNWRLYDSVYSERYMYTPAHNNEGYDRSAVRNVTAIAQNERFLVMHGTGDDNVHFQNTLVLLDKLDQGNVENYDVHVFPDSDHSIAYHNANTIVYDKLRDWIVKAFDDKFKDF